MSMKRVRFERVAIGQRFAYSDPARFWHVKTESVEREHGCCPACGSRRYNARDTYGPIHACDNWLVWVEDVPQPTTEALL